MRQLIRRRQHSGNALMEYAVPAAILLLTAGILATSTNLNGMLGEYFLSASGNTKAALSGGVFKPKAFSDNVTGNPKNGSDAFPGFPNTPALGSLQNGDGTAAPSDGLGGIGYNAGPVGHSSAPPPTGPEALYGNPD